MEHPTWCRQRAAEIGPSTAVSMERLLGDKVLDRLGGAQATLRLAETFGPKRLEAACARALACDAIAFVTLKTMLQRGMELQPLPGIPPAPKPSTPPLYARSFFDLFNPADPATTSPKGNDPWTSSIN